MKLNNKHTSIDYALEHGSELNVCESYENDSVTVTPNKKKQGSHDVESRILSSVETDCRHYSKDEINVRLNDCKVFDADVDFNDDETIITLRGDNDRHGLIITIHGSKKRLYSHLI